MGYYSEPASQPPMNFLHFTDVRACISGSCYTEGGIFHQEPYGKLFSGPFSRPSLRSLAGKDGSTLNNIIIRNLSNDATEQDIRSIFETYGTIQRFKILTDSKTGQPKAFVEMTDDAAAETAIGATNGTAVRGSTVSVNAARPQLHRGSRSK